MAKIRLPYVLFIIFGILLTVGTQSGWLKNGVDAAINLQPGLYSVEQYIDGDTLAINMNGATEIIRFIGVDTPETHKPNTPVQCYGEAAATYTKQRISQFGKVRLQADPLNTNRDRYGRLLRYIYLPDGTLMDSELIRTGHGFAYLGFPFELADQFAQDQQQAQKDLAGLWGACQPQINEYGGYTSNPA